jgi:predicted  nucleic acid-binding Zn-ribbon protein
MKALMNWLTKRHQAALREIASTLERENVELRGKVARLTSELEHARENEAAWKDSANRSASLLATVRNALEESCT